MMGVVTRNLEDGGGATEEAFMYCMLSLHICVCIAMKRHGNDNEGKQPDKRPRLQQALCTHTTDKLDTL